LVQLTRRRKRGTRSKDPVMKAIKIRVDPRFLMNCFVQKPDKSKYSFRALSS
jgi:hypothetical protein